MSRGRRPLVLAATVAAAVALILTTVPASSSVIQHSAEQAAVRHFTGALPNGTTWIADVPTRWNGTLLLWGHGYVPDPATNSPNIARPLDAAAALVDRGYAVAASSYGHFEKAAGTARRA